MKSDAGNSNYKETPEQETHPVRKENQKVIDYGTVFDLMKALTGFIFVVYFLGFLIVGFYFLKYEYFIFNLLKARYISAGTIFILLFSFVTFINLLMAKLPSSSELRSLVIGLLVTLFFGWSLVSLIAWGESYPNQALFLASLLLLYFLVDSLFNAIRNQGIVTKDVLIWLLQIFGFLAFFGALIYGFIPASIGGGRPAYVKFLFETNNPAVVLPFKIDSCYSQPLRLVDQTDKTYLLFINYNGKDKLFELDKTLIKGVIYGVMEKPEKLK